MPEQPNNAGRGPLGVPTNSPINDPGTSARIQNRPNVPIGTITPQHEARKSTARLGGNRELRMDRFPLLKLGARGNDVQRLQRLVNIHLEKDKQLKVDGIFGPKTRAAVLEFQKEEELKPDAMVGRDTWFSLISTGTQEASWTAKPPAPPTKVVASSTTTATKKTVDQWTLEERFEYVLKHCGPYLAPDIRAQFTALLTPVNLGIMVGSLVVWAAGHFFGVSEVADAFLLGFGLVFLGKAAIDAARLLKNVIEITCSASTEAELEDAAKDLAEAISIIGVMTFFALLAKVARAIGSKLKAPKATERGGGQPEDSVTQSKSKLETGKPKNEEEPAKEEPAPKEEDLKSLAKKPGNSPEQIAARKSVANSFYRKAGMKDADIESHIACIDTDKPVEVVKVPPNGGGPNGDQLWQWNAPGKRGQYFSTDPSTPPEQLGIHDKVQLADGTVVDKVQSSYTVKAPTEGLRSTAAPANDVWSIPGETHATPGGGIQIFVPKSTQSAFSVN